MTSVTCHITFLSNIRLYILYKLLGGTGSVAERSTHLCAEAYWQNYKLYRAQRLTVPFFLDYIERVCHPTRFLVRIQFRPLHLNLFKIADRRLEVVSKRTIASVSKIMSHFFLWLHNPSLLYRQASNRQKLI